MILLFAGSITELRPRIRIFGQLSLRGIECLRAYFTHMIYPHQPGAQTPFRLGQTVVLQACRRRLTRGKSNAAYYSQRTIKPNDQAIHDLPFYNKSIVSMTKIRCFKAT
jgi:hypothetical protein